MKGIEDKDDNGFFSVHPMTEKDIEFEKLRHKNEMIEERLRHKNKMIEKKVTRETYKEATKMLKLSEKVSKMNANKTPYKMSEKEIEVMSKSMAKTIHEIETKEQQGE